MLIINELSVFYGKNKVLQGLALKCVNAKIHGILGMNGAGKTTLFNAIYGFLPKDSGSCLFKGQPVSKKEVAYLETVNFFYSYMTGKEYLQLCSLQNPNFNIEEWNRVFQLPLGNLIDTYSTGMKKKLALQGVIALDRPILILDEPFNGVDFESSEVIYEILKRLRKQGKTILLSSHIIESLTNICNSINYLSNGKIEKTYVKSEFGMLETELRSAIKEKVSDALNEIFDSTQLTTDNPQPTTDN